MTTRPFIPSTADRLAQPNRPRPLVFCGPECRKDGAKSLFPRFKPDQGLGQFLDSAAFIPDTVASVSVKEPADNTLSP